MSPRMALTGLVIKFDPERGFGFIRAPEEERDIFVHVSQVDGGSNLAVGEQVRFDLEQTPKGPRAVRVQPLRVGRSAAAIFVMLGSAVAIVVGVAFDRLAGAPGWASYLAGVNTATLALVAYDRAVRGRGLVPVPRPVFWLFALVGGVVVALLGGRLTRDAG
jgi:CspA family cold shock protein